MPSVKDVIDELTKRQLDSISRSPSIRNAFIDDVVQEHGFDKQQVIRELSTRVSIVEQKDVKIEMKVIKPAPVWDEGNDFKTKQKKAKIMNEILDSLRLGGKSMTNLLKSINKDNTTWRDLAKEVINYMVARESIVKVGSKYYISIDKQHRENDFHRKIYSMLCAKPQTLTSLLIGVNYNNPKGKKKVLQVLEILQSERFVSKLGKQYILIEGVGEIV